MTFSKFSNKKKIVKKKNIQLKNIYKNIQKRNYLKKIKKH